MARIARTVLAALAAPLVLAACDAGAGAGTETFTHETGAPCTRETSAANCEQAEDLAVALEDVDGVDSVEFEFRTIDGEGVSELIFVVAAAGDAAADDVAGAIAVGLREVPAIDAGRDLSLTVTRAGATLHLDPAEDPDPAAAAGILVAAGALAPFGTVETSLAPAEVRVELPSGKRYGDIGPVAHAAADLRLPPGIDVVIASGGSYFSRNGLTEQDAAWWDRVARATEGVDATIGVDGRDVGVTIEPPAGVRPADFTFDEYGDRYWPMVSAHLDLARELGRGASYTVDTNWPETDDGFDVFLDAVVGPGRADPDPRGWNEAAEAHLG